MQKRILLLPLVWGVFGIGEFFALTYLFGPIISNIPYAGSDKPIGGSYLPALFFSVAAILALIGLSLYSLGIWEIDFSSRKVKIDLAALGIMCISGVLIFSYAIFLFPLAVTLVYFLATNVD